MRKSAQVLVLLFLGPLLVPILVVFVLYVFYSWMWLIWFCWTHSDRVYLMHEGRVVVHGKPAEILASPLARKVYLGEGFDLELSDEPRAEAPQAASLAPDAPQADPEGHAA